MTSEIETAASRAGTAQFPARWGEPRGARFSAERRAWIQGNISADETVPERLRQRAAEARSRVLDQETEGLVTLAAGLRGEVSANE